MALMDHSSGSLNELFTALSKAQKEIKGAIKDSVNPFYKNSYADLQSVWDACKEPLSKYGLCIVQTTDIREGLGPVLITTLGHTSGQFIKGVLPIQAIKNDSQAQGSALSYARRYALAAIVGVYQVDDDAEMTTKRPTEDVAHKKPIAQTQKVKKNADYIIPVGFFINKKIADVAPTELANYVLSLRKKAADSNRSIEGPWLEMIEKIEGYLND
jgi:hypothetical protein